MNFRKHLINRDSTIKYALELLSNIGMETILFAINDKGQLIGSLTDGDIRRGLIKGHNINDKVHLCTQENPKYIKKELIDINEIIQLRKNKFKLIPIVDNDFKVINIITKWIYDKQ